MTIETTVNDLVASVGALTTSVVDKRTVLDNAAQQAAASLTTTQAKQAAAEASAATAAAKATEATNNATQVAAYKTAAAALDTTTTATAAVANLLPDMLAKKDPARHPFRNKLPTLVLDFERQKAHRYSDSTGFAETPLASLMTFTRSSTATYTGPDGVLRTAAVNEPRYDYDPVTGECRGLLVEEQRTNVALYSTGMSLYPNSGDTTTSVTPEWVDGLILTRLVSSGVMGRRIIWFGAALRTNPVVFQCRVKKGVGQIVLGFAPWEASESDSSTITLDTATGGFSFVKSGRHATFTPTVVSCGRTWLITAALTYSSGTCTLGMLSVSTTTAADVTIGAWQVEAGAFPTSYIPSTDTFTGRTSTATYLDVNGVVQTAGVGVARSAAYDYDADGVLRPIGLLLEASATNLLRHSSDYTNAVWTKNFGGVGTTPVVTSAYGTAPDGTTTAQRVQLALNGGGSIDDYASISQSVTTVAGNTYTESVWLKTADASTKVVQLSFNGDVTQLLTVTGTWKRFSITGTALDTNRGFRLALRGTTGTSDSADLLMWGAQHGLGTYPTSYIPTTSAQVTRATDTSTSAQSTRAADNASMPTTGWRNDKGGTLGVKAVINNPSVAADITGTGRGLACLHDGTVNNRVRVGCNQAADGVIYTSGVEQFNTTQWSASAGEHRVAISTAKNSGRVAYDSTVSAEDTSLLLPQVTTLNIGRSDYQYGYLSGHIKRLTYYPMTMTNEELQVLTSA